MYGKTTARLIFALGIATTLASPGHAQGVLTTHRLSAALAAEAVDAAVAACTKQGYHVTATIIDPDGAIQAMLRGDGAGIVAVKSSYDKAYTVIMLGTTNNMDSSGAIAQRIGPNPPAGGIAKFAHIALQPGAFRIKVGNEAVAAIGVGGAPGGEHDEDCAKAGIAKIADQLK
jgi:uncharacterized protein GlcG (DUF336 family)